MKLYFTDKFLSDIYDFLETTSDVGRFIFRRRRTFYDIRTEENPVFEKYRKERGRRKFNKFINYLKKHNYIKVQNVKGIDTVILTKKGINKTIKANFKTRSSLLQERTDGKWIMISFDIPQRYNKSRSLLRSILQNLGYKMFQQSVWISPYDVSRKTEDLLQFYSLDKYVRIFLIKEI